MLNRVGIDRWESMIVYSERHRVSRKMMHSYVGTAEALQRLAPLEELEACRFVHNVLKEPQQRTNHLRA